MPRTFSCLTRPAALVVVMMVAAALGVTTATWFAANADVPVHQGLDHSYTEVRHVSSETVTYTGKYACGKNW
jgi:hypothetical protein